MIYSTTSGSSAHMVTAWPSLAAWQARALPQAPEPTTAIFSIRRLLHSSLRILDGIRSRRNAIRTDSCSCRTTLSLDRALADYGVRRGEARRLRAASASGAVSCSAQAAAAKSVAREFQWESSGRKR